MAPRRKTKAAQWKEGCEAEALEQFLGVLGKLPDPRRKQGLRYKLKTVVVVALMAMVCGADDGEAMQRWGETNQKWLSTFLETPHGTPTQDVFLSVFAALNPDRFAEVVRGWVALLQLRIRAAPDQKHLAIDGKTLRRSHDRAEGKQAIHMLSAWLVDSGLVVAQTKVSEKSNEIPAIPELLALLDLTSTTVTIDAMGCQTKIAQAVRDGAGDYVLAVRANQPTLLAGVAESFAEAAEPDRRPFDAPTPVTIADSWQETTRAHGRIEEREVEVIRDLRRLGDEAKRWAGIGLVAKVSSKRTILATGKETQGCRFFIGSNAASSAAEVAGYVRRHWTIENSLHWVLDMAFDEDRSRHRARNCAENMALLRHVALDLLKTEKTNKLGVANKRKSAGWDRNYLIRVIAGAPG